MNDRAAEKVLVVGLDGATNDLLVPWAEQGYLPTLARLMEEGVHGDLLSTIHPLTAPAWTSFMTGKSPGKHGVFDFIARKEGRYDVTLVDSRTRDQQTLWHLLGEAGLRVGVLNVPLNYPPQPVNGWMISWMDAPNVDSGLTYPEGLLAEIRENVGEYILTVDFHASLDDYIGQLHRMIENRSRVTQFLMESRPWDLMTVLFSATDYVQHAFWKYMDRTHPGYTARGGQRYGNVIREVYRRIDAELETILQKAGEDTRVFVISDHGAGQLRKAVNLNRWLELNGYLTFNSSSRRGGIRRRCGQLLGRLFTAMKRRLPTSWKGALRQALPALRDQVESYLFSSAICWEQTRAFSLGAYGNIWINLDGREPRGTVHPGDEYDALCAEIIDKLQALTEPDTGTRVVEKVHRREDLYEGPFVERAPDLVVQWTDYAYHSRQRFGEREDSVFADSQTMPLSRLEMNGFHRLNGVFMARGPGIEEGSSLTGARLIDLAPTLLYMFGLPIPDDMDGEVLRGIFSADYTRGRPAVSRKHEQESQLPEKEGGYTEKAEATVMDRLRGLGYVD